jgi:hypothetical protein
MGVGPGFPEQTMSKALDCLSKLRVGDGDQIRYLALRVARVLRRVNHGSK